MGQGQSQNTNDERIFESKSSVQLSQGLVNHLSDTLASSSVPPARQNTLDQHVRQRIDSEIALIKEKESEIIHEIEQALDKESLDTKDQVVDGKVRSSLSLQNDLDEVRHKVDRYKTRRELPGIVEVRKKSDAVAECYRKHPQTSLECWQEVEAFKSSVASLEQSYIDSFR